MLSVCIIVRNEEKFLPRAITSVRGIADEVVVADTGSTDRSVEIARELGAVVCYFPWCDDFSAARNFALKHCRGNWIFWLDADEELLPESVNELRSSMAREDALAFLVLRQDLNQANRLDYFTTMWQERLFRRRDDLRFLGRCHEREVTSEAQGCYSSITIRHYGYIGELLPGKLRRAARLLELELRDRPGQLYYLIEYGRTLAMLKDERAEGILREAAAKLLPHLRQSQAPMPIVSLLLEQLLQYPPDQLPAGFRPELVEALVWRWFPANAPLLWLLARRAATVEKFDAAERILRRLVEMGKDHSYEQWVSFDPRLVGADAKSNLGACLLRQGKLAEAISIFRELRDCPSHAAQARSNLDAIEKFMEQMAASKSGLSTV